MRTFVLPVLLVLIFGVVGLLLNGGLWTWVGLAAFMTMILFLAMVRFGRIHASRSLRERLMNLSFVAMGLLSFVFAFALIRDAIWILGWMMAPDFFPPEPSQTLGNEFIYLTSVCAFAAGTYWGGLGPRLKNVTVKIKNLPEALQGLKLVQISDLHIGPTIDRKYVEKVVALSNAADADLVVFTGDIGDGHPHELQAAIAPLAQLRAKSGIFYVPGNHEYYWDLDAWIRELEGTGATALMNSSRHIPIGNAHVLMAGITDPAAKSSSRHAHPSIEKTIASTPREHLAADLRILLSHRPHFAREAEKAGFHLQLSGHTHGGQFFPWTLVVKFVHEFSKGLHATGGLWIYVSQGTGSWGPRLRLGTTPELTVLCLQVDA